jgi:hypothetical protein
MDGLTPPPRARTHTLVCKIQAGKRTLALAHKCSYTRACVCANEHTHTHTHTHLSAKKGSSVGADSEEVRHFVRKCQPWIRFVFFFFIFLFLSKHPSLARSLSLSPSLSRAHSLSLTRSLTLSHTLTHSRLSVQGEPFVLGPVGHPPGTHQVCCFARFIS